jgi:hypothetical protein
MWRVHHTALADRFETKNVVTLLSDSRQLIRWQKPEQGVLKHKH